MTWTHWTWLHLRIISTYLGAWFYWWFFLWKTYLHFLWSGVCAVYVRLGFFAWILFVGFACGVFSSLNIYHIRMDGHGKWFINILQIFDQRTSSFFAKSLNILQRMSVCSDGPYHHLFAMNYECGSNNGNDQT